MIIFILLLAIPLAVGAARSSSGAQLKRRIRKLGNLNGRPRSEIDAALRVQPHLARTLDDGSYVMVYAQNRFAFGLVYYANDICKGIMPSSIVDNTRPLISHEATRSLSGFAPGLPFRITEPIPPRPDSREGADRP